MASDGTGPTRSRSVVGTSRRSPRRATTWSDAPNSSPTTAAASVDGVPFGSRSMSVVRRPTYSCGAVPTMPIAIASAGAVAVPVTSVAPRVIAASNVGAPSTLPQCTARCRRRGQPAVDGGVEAARRSDQHDRSRRRQEGGVRRGRHLDQVATRRQVARQGGDERVGGVTDDDPRSDRRRAGAHRLAFDPRRRPELVGQLGDPGRFPRHGCRDGGRRGDGSHRGRCGTQC